MRKTALVLGLCLTMLCPLFATQSFDIGDGRTLILNDDGSYEVVDSSFDTSRIIGRQYVIDTDALIDSLIDMAALEDPSILLLGRDFARSLLVEMGIEELISSEIPDLSFIVLSADRMLVTMSGEDPVECSYSITGGGSITIDLDDGSEPVRGSVKEDGSAIDLKSDGITIRLIPVDA